MNSQQSYCHQDSLIRRGVIISVIVLIYICLPLGILIGLIPWNMKFVTLIAGAIVAYLISRLLGYTNLDLGITLRRARPSLIAVAPFTLVFLVASILWLMLGGVRFKPTEDLGFFIFYIFISCPIQELLFRGVLSSLFNSFKMREYIEIIVASLLFGFVHIIYQDAITVVIMTIVGYFWYSAYKREPSLVGVTISHIILGVFTIVVGLVD